MAKQILTDLDFNNVSRITNLPDGTASGQPVTFDQLKSAIEGMAWKDDVAAASTANINLAAPGGTVDGRAMQAGDRFLAKNQTDQTENGVYIWNGAATPATRAPDMNVSAEFNSAVVPVTSGDTNSGTRWRCTVINPTLGTTNITWTNDNATAPSASESAQGIAELATQAETDAGTDDQRIVTPKKLKEYAGGAKRYATDIGDGTATSYTVTHNLGTRDVNVMIRRNSGNYDEVIADVQATTVNTVTIVFGAAIGANAFRVVVTA